MLQVRQFRYGADNLGYLVYGPSSAMAVDGGAGDDIRAFLEKNRLSLLYVANTHDHRDHTCGNEYLLRMPGVRFLPVAELSPDREIPLDGSKIRVIGTSGHTDDSRVFYTGGALIAGDTLFNGTIGNCFSGDLEGFYRSIRELMTFPDETIVYAGHDYVRDSMAFARHLEPENPEIDRFLAGYNPDHVFSTLAQEKRINPYFRFNEPGIVALLAKRGLPHGTERERWLSLMRIE
ncbi:MAG: MBL fold metallo-hydrolase [Thermodesulfobacteriota bacterium]